MLRSIAEFSKTIKKYSYYPMLIGFVCLAATAAYDGPRATLGLMGFAVCAVLIIIALLSSWLCKAAGIDDTIK